MLTYGVPSYKLEKDVIDAEIEILKELGVEFKCGVDVGEDVTIEDLKKEGYKAFYIAIGCQGGKLPGIPNETAPGTDFAVHFLHEAIENENQSFKNEEVVVVGGGNVAVDCSRTSLRFSPNKVSMYCLESREEMPASIEEIKETLEEHVELNNGWGPKEIVVDEKGHVSAIVFKKCIRTIDPETKKFSPLYDETITKTVKADRVIFAIGQAIEWKNLLKGSKVTFWHGNYPIADKLTYQTADPDIFVGGDVYTGPKFAIDAIQAGKMAADSLHRYVQPGSSLTIGRNKYEFVSLNKDDIEIKSYDTAGRQEAGLDETIDYHKSFRDAHKLLSAEQVHTEASRCLGCGMSIVDPNKCIGCGVCTTRCEFDAIHLFRDHPECSKMMKSEDKFKAILPYAIKRSFKIKFGKKTKEEKLAIKKHKAYKKAKKAAKKKNA